MLRYTNLPVFSWVNLSIVINCVFEFPVFVSVIIIINDHQHVLYATLQCIYMILIDIIISYSLILYSALWRCQWQTCHFQPSASMPSFESRCEPSACQPRRRFACQALWNCKVLIRHLPLPKQACCGQTRWAQQNSSFVVDLRISSIFWSTMTASTQESKLLWLWNSEVFLPILVTNYL